MVALVGSEGQGGGVITFRRAEERRYQARRRERTWLSFDPSVGAALPVAPLEGLQLLEERRLSPQGGAKSSHGDMEIITYVREGTLLYEDPTGRSGIIMAGEFQRMTLGVGSRYRDTNASSTDWAHIFQIWLRPTVAGLQPGHEQRRFHTADRSGRLCLVASLDGRAGSLQLHQDTRIFSAILERGLHVAYPVAPKRGAWLHMVDGSATVEGEVLRAGDGAWVAGQPILGLIASQDAEILLLDMVEPVAGVDVGPLAAAG